MSLPRKAAPVKLFIGFIYSDEDVLNKTIKLLENKYGQIDSYEGPIPFTHTEYYKETGDNLKKYFISFKKNIKRDNIARIKLHSNKIEKKFQTTSKRQINIDPGYLTLSNVFLASCKDYYHRIYIGKNIFLENELRYTQKKYIPFEWTYPDYVSPEYIDYFLRLRKIYHNSLK